MWSRRAARFQEIVQQRGDELRRMPFSELADLREPTEWIEVGGWLGSIATIIQPVDDGRLLVVVQGFLPVRWLPFLKHVGLHGFYKLPDGSVTPMAGHELYEFD
jgi:hypothetical protein